MKKAIERFILGASAAAIMLAICVGTVPAQDKKDAGDIKEAIEEGRGEAQEATKLLNELMSDPERRIPRSILQKAIGIAVFTNIAKGGLIVGGSGGDGVIARRTANGWSAPVFYNVGGGNVGFQIGFEKGDFIMLFMQEGALKDLLDDNLELGANVSYAAGTIDGGASATTNLTGNEAVLTYSRANGLFGGATVGGGTITADNSRNQAFYKMNGGQVLENPQRINISKLPTELRAFTKTVENYFK